MGLKINGQKSVSLGDKKPDYTGFLDVVPVSAQTSTVKTIKGQEVAGTHSSKEEVVNKGVYIEPSELLRIGVEGSRTLNLGNFESAKIGVTLTMPCTKETLGDAYDWATNWVSDRLEEAVKSAKGL